MKTLFVLLLLIVGVSSAQAQEPATPAAPPRLMAACESLIKGMGKQSNWIANPIEYSTTGAGGWIGKTTTFNPPVPGMTAKTVAAVDGQFTMWAHDSGANYVYTAYEVTNAVDQLIYFRCKADPTTGAAIPAIERAPAQAAADE